MAFMILFSLFPFIIFLLALTSFLGVYELGHNFVDFLIKGLPVNVVPIITNRLEEITKAPHQSLMRLAILGTIWTSSSFVESLRTILNRIYLLKRPPSYLLRRLFSIIQIFLITISLAFLMFLLVIVPIIFNKIPQLETIFNIMNNYHLPWVYLRYFLIFISLFIGVMFLYYVIPNVKMKFSQVISGALLTVVLWWGSAMLLSRYIIYYNQLSIIYGSLGSIILTLLFFYIISVIFIYGAEFNYLFEHKIIT